MKSFAKFEYISEKYAGGDQSIRQQIAADRKDRRTTSKLSRLRQVKNKKADEIKSNKEYFSSKGMKSVKRGIQSVMDKTKSRVKSLKLDKENLKKKAGSEEGRGVGRSATGAFKSVFDFKPDTERTDTGGGGMGTAMRNMTNVGKAAISGAINAPAETLDKKRSTIGGKILGRGKRVFQSKIGIKDKQKSPQGRKISKGQGDKIAQDLEDKTRKGDKDALTVNQLAKNPGGGKTLSTQTGRMGIKRDQLIKDRKAKGLGFGNLSRSENRPYTDKTGRTQRAPVASSVGFTAKGANRETAQEFGKNVYQVGNSARRKEDRMNQIAGSKEKQARKKSSAITKSIVKTDNVRKRADSLSKMGNDTRKRANYLQRIRQNLQNVNNTTDASSGGKRKGRGKSSILNPASSGRNIKKKMVNRNTPKDGGAQGQSRIEKELGLNDQYTPTKEKTMNLKELNAIALRKELANKGIQTKARSFDEIQQEKIKNKALENAKKRGTVMVTNNESYSHWREEFIWETDKKYPEKIKEIKPMSGKNNITINPEDETSKYKRGY